MAARTTKGTDAMIDCPRCDGTGIYRGFGVCYRCNGRKRVNAPPPRKAEPAREPLTRDELAEKVGDDLADAAHAYKWDR